MNYKSPHLIKKKKSHTFRFIPVIPNSFFRNVIVFWREMTFQTQAGHECNQTSTLGKLQALRASLSLRYRTNHLHYSTKVYIINSVAEITISYMYHNITVSRTRCLIPGYRILSYLLFSNILHVFPKLCFSLELLEPRNESNISIRSVLWFSVLCHILLPHFSSLQRVLWENIFGLFSRNICLLDRYSQQLFLSTGVIFLGLTFLYG